MNASRGFQRIVCVCLLAAMAAGPVCAQDVLDLIPADSLAVVRINQFDNTLGQVDKFLSGIAPMPVQMMIRGQMGQMLGSPELTGVDMNGSFAAFVVVPEGASGPAALSQIYPGVLIPVSNYDQFISGNANCGEPDEHGVSAISGPGSTTDTPWLIATKTGSHALITMANLHPQILQYQEMMGINTSAAASMATMAGGIAADDAKAARQSPVWIYGDVARASQIFKPMVDGGFAMLKSTVAQQMAKDMKEQGQVMDIGMIMNMYGAMLDMVMTQAQSFSLAIHPEADMLRFSETISAKPGTDLAAMLAKDATGRPNKLIGFAEDGAAMSLVGHLGDSWRDMYTTSIDLVSEMVGESLTDENAARMKKMIARMVDVLEGPIAFSFSIDAANKPPFDIKYVFAVKDAEAFKGLLKESVELFNESGVADIYNGMGIEMGYSVDYAASTYKGVSIDSARLTMKSSQPENPMGKIVDGMYGGGFDYRWAIVNKTCAVAVGGDVDSQIRQMIDRIKAGTHQTMGTEMRTAFSVLPGADQADFVMTYNYVRLFSMVGAFAEIMGEEAPDIDVKSTSHLSIAGWGGENRARFDVAIPKQHVMEMISVFSSLQQAQKNKQQNQAHSHDQDHSHDEDHRHVSETH
ncbi:MAG: hypothetical protein HQ515_00320 [Phycisphaeraceae bacterium]|nr:hypothetical protein [Phycisphaeraceae bacterium]